MEVAAPDTASDRAAKFRLRHSATGQPTKILPKFHLGRLGGSKRGIKRWHHMGIYRGIHKGIQRLLGKEGMGILFSLKGTCFHYRDNPAYSLSYPVQQDCSVWPELRSIKADNIIFTLGSIRNWFQQKFHLFVLQSTTAAKVLIHKTHGELNLLVQPRI